MVLPLDLPQIIANRAALALDKNQFDKRSTALFGPRKVIPAERTLASRFVLPGNAKARSTVTTAGQQPDGFGNSVQWASQDTSLALVIFLNAADPIGLMISGVTDGDQIELASATGLASFKESVQNEGVASLIGLVAAGASVTAAAFGAPQLAPAISAASAYAQDRFKEKQVRTGIRDPFGEQPSDGHKAKQEGGVLISLPAAGRAFYSGDSDHRNRWIKEPGTRDDAHRPSHVRNAFYLRPRPHHKRRATSDGDFLIYPWDHKFDDNRGFYRLHVLLRRMPPTDPDID
ncbi:hypothetical protein [Cryptosporangium minutisporangium]|uniref:Uncharacterized protein n=1 Tax=Cryptosporangium minutisporangium TaxID=113569 RepID=A0ABP6SRN9_9ACTN